MLYYTYVCYIHLIHTYCTHVSVVPVHPCCIHTTYILHLIWVDINEFCKDQWLWVDKGCEDSPVVGDGAGSFLALFYVLFRYWLVVTGTMEFYDFPFSWEWKNHPN